MAKDRELQTPSKHFPCKETSHSNTEVPTLFTKEPTLAFPGFPPSEEPTQLKEPQASLHKQPHQLDKMVPGKTKSETPNHSRGFGTITLYYVKLMNVEWAGVKGFLVHPCPTPTTCLLYGGSSETFPSTNTKQIPRMTGFQKVQVRETQHCWSLKQHQSKLRLVTKAPFASAIIKGSAEGKGKHSSKHRAPISLSCIP